MNTRQRVLAIPPAIHAAAVALVATSVIHLALVPQHLKEAPVLGVMFLLAGIAGLGLIPSAYLNVGKWRAASALLLATLIIGYGATRISGYEDWDVLGLVTKLVEAGGLMAIWISAHEQAGSTRRARLLPSESGGWL